MEWSNNKARQNGKINADGWYYWFDTAETDQESCSGTDLDGEKESDDSDIDYLSDNEPQIQFVHSQQVQCTTNDTDDDVISNVNKANVNDDNSAGLTQGDSAKNYQFKNIDDHRSNSDEDTRDIKV